MKAAQTWTPSNFHVANQCNLWMHSIVFIILYSLCQQGGQAGNYYFRQNSSERLQRLAIILIVSLSMKSRVALVTQAGGMKGRGQEGHPTETVVLW